MSSSAAPSRSEPVPVADKILSTLDRFLHIEALSGVVLLIATATALIWANSPAAHSYHEFWESRVAVGFGTFSLSQSVHFLVNDGLMTIYFLVVGLEIHRENHEDASATVHLAALPLATAFGGVLVPALIHSAINTEPALRASWEYPPRPISRLLCANVYEVQHAHPTLARFHHSVSQLLIPSCAYR